MPEQFDPLLIRYIIDQIGLMLMGAGDLPVLEGVLRLVARPLPDALACALAYRPAATGDELLLLVDLAKPHVQDHVRHLLHDHGSEFCGPSLSTLNALVRVQS